MCCQWMVGKIPLAGMVALLVYNCSHRKVTVMKKEAPRATFLQAAIRVFLCLF